jgi:ribosomal protein L19
MQHIVQNPCANAQQALHPIVVDNAVEVRLVVWSPVVAKINLMGWLL